MQVVRTYLSWLFAFSALVCALMAMTLTVTAIRDQYSLHSIYGRWSGALLFIAPLMMLSFAAVLALAWWAVYKKKPSARWWGIAASLITMQAGIFPIIFPPHSLMSFSYLTVTVGVVGVIAFARKSQQRDTAPELEGSPSVPGDGTSTLLNKSAQVLEFVFGAVAYYWWLGWAGANDVPAPEGSGARFVAATFIGIVIVTFHELGHSLAGLGLGMKVRAFLVGPFQWQIRDGRWEFRFSPGQLLVEGGRTGVVPSRANFPRSAQLFMSASGILVNVVTGALALWVALSVGPDPPVQLHGLLALFGVWSIVVGAFNLLPFRVGTNYSDGAQIYQLLSKGAWSDYHHIITVAGSSVVTAVRPRDYDIVAILRTAETINTGFQAFLLRLLAYSFFLDSGKFPAASGTLSEVASLYNQSAAEISPEVLTVLAFGTAYLGRDASGARQWWDRFLATKPTRFNVDYWLAASALHWVEGSCKAANDAWDKANACAQQLPKAGAYEFDRHCCSLLRQALDEVPATA